MTREQAREFLVRKVAQIIHDTVEWCGDGERAETDWGEAERLVDGWFQWMIGRMCGEPVPSDDWADQFQDWESIGIDDAERELGSCVWANLQYLRRYLPRPPYGKVTFE